MGKRKNYITLTGFITKQTLLSRATGMIRTCAHPIVISRCACEGGGLDVLMLTTLTSALSNIK